MGSTSVDREQLDTVETRDARRALVSELCALGDLSSERVRAAMLRVPRHLFVPLHVRPSRAYANHALPIGYGQTISQPSVVAIMTEALDLAGDERVLEIGTGSGYQAAILGELAAEVYTVEIVPELAERARELLRKLEYRNVQVRIGDGRQGWPEHAPFDRILVTAGAPVLPEGLTAQLAPEGILVAPVGPAGLQSLIRHRKKPGGTTTEDLGPVAFVPLTGEGYEPTPGYDDVF
jgi:protein-L-isoaspartate(D-aspartate) O-methyltransferase